MFLFCLNVSNVSKILMIMFQNTFAGSCFFVMYSAAKNAPQKMGDLSDADAFILVLFLQGALFVLYGAKYAQQKMGQVHQIHLI